MSRMVVLNAAFMISVTANLCAEQTAKTYCNRGNENYQKGDFTAAAADYTRAIELDPKYADAYQQRADVWEKTKQYDSSIKDIRKAIELAPKNGEYYLDLAWYELLNRNPHEAIAASLEGLKLSPGNAAMIKTNLAHAYLFDNQFDKAKAIYLENKDTKVRGEERTFGEVALDDFEQLDQAGITHEDIEKIKALLQTKFPSPDRRFALRTTDNQVQLIENDSGQVMMDLGEPWRSQVLVWSPDSKWVAYANRGDKAGEVSVYFWNGSAFEEVTLPADLPSPDIKFRKEHKTGHIKNYGGAVTPLKWLKSGDLELSSDSMMLHSDSGATYTGELKFILAFDPQHHASVKNVGKTKTEVDE